MRDRILLTILLTLVLMTSGCGDAPAPRSYGLEDLDAPVPRSIEYVGSFPNRETEPYAPVERPSSVAMLPDYRLFYADWGANRIHMFDDNYDYLGVADEPGQRGWQPYDVNTHGFLFYVLDLTSQRILRYNADGAYRDVLVDIAAVDPQANVRSSAFAVDTDGRMAICDEAGHRVLLVGPFNDLESAVGEYGSLLGQFRSPKGAAFGPSGLLYVSDHDNSRVQVFDQTGQVLSSTEGWDSPDPLCVGPAGLACDRFGNVFVCDPAASRVQVLAPDLRPLATVGDDEFADDDLRQPVDCTVGPDNRLYVVDAGQNALMIYDIVYP